MNKLLFSLFITLGFIYAGKAFSQPKASWLNKLELGLSVGPQFFLGDLGGGLGPGSNLLKDIDLQET
ncbi:MAG: hypothetical protein ACK420_00790, partial [Sphingomonadales bacterium]